MPTIPTIEGNEKSPKILSTRQQNGIEDTPTYASGQFNVTPSTLSFLCPLFLILIIGPLIIFFYVRRKRRERAMQGIIAELRARPTAKKTPAISQEEARARLADAAEVVLGDEKRGVVTEGEQRRVVIVRTVENGDDGDVEKGGVNVEEKEETVSLGERECAICLSSLSTPTSPLSTPSIPSPPAPAKLAALPLPSTDFSSNEPPKTSPTATAISSPIDKQKDVDDDEEQEEEPILRLKKCNHEFHDSCLLSWCVLGKVSCPVCRAVFFGPEPEEKGEGEGGEEEEEGAAAGEERNQESRNETGMGAAR
ncbi:hypothetical protein DM02DRAFT_632708 [Periconia macrospinosa]|uniref:RING-type domain-containing protein n=1 Tax=Periconia macrospinosa TaxID=97972 RepID=A0A2V1DBZ2_9PLEO|nr:hypothetical protein DM02DRAFT_632708 [Periconia macrospinosa]